MLHQHYRHQDLTIHHHFKRTVHMPARQHHHLRVQRPIQMIFDAICVIFQQHGSMSLFYTIKRMLQTRLQNRLLNRHEHQVRSVFENFLIRFSAFGYTLFGFCCWCGNSAVQRSIEFN